MGWLYSPDWKTKQELLYDWVSYLEAADYTVSMSGNWAYVEKNGDPVDLIYVKTEKCDGEWGYKDISVTLGPYCYSAPLWMVLKVHPIFKDNHYYQGWLEKYPKKNKVLESDQKTFTPLLFEEAV